MSMPEWVVWVAGIRHVMQYPTEEANRLGLEPATPQPVRRQARAANKARTPRDKGGSSDVPDSAPDGGVTPAG